MATKPNDDFQWEVEGDTPETSETPEAKKPEEDVEIVDDTPEEDRNRAPMPKDLVEELEADELEDYSEKVKLRLKQMKKVWHDERREKEREAREKTEAASLAQRLLEENRRLKATLSEGEQTLIGTYKQNAELELERARREYREAYEAADTDKMIAAQEKLSKATMNLDRVQSFRPTLQDATPEVQGAQQQVQVPQPDTKTRAWQERNSWWGTDPEMTASALGLHQKLERERGPQFVGSDDYWATIDKTMRRRFPEYFGDERPTGTPAKGAGNTRPANVVAPASRSTSSKKIVLTQSQVALAKRLGITPEQYAREFAKTER